MTPPKTKRTRDKHTRGTVSLRRNKQRPRTDKVLRRTACQGLCAPETPLKGVINMISFFVGVMVGGIVGVFFMALVNASYNEREDE